jgi:hypothetical protein
MKINLSSVLTFLTGTVAPAFGPLGQIVGILLSHQQPATNPVLTAAPFLQDVINLIVAVEQASTAPGETQGQAVANAIHVAYSQFPALNNTVPEHAAEEIVAGVYALIGLVAKHQAAAVPASPVIVTPLQPAAVPVAAVPVAREEPAAPPAPPAPAPKKKNGGSAPLPEAGSVPVQSLAGVTPAPSDAVFADPTGMADEGRGAE